MLSSLVLVEFNELNFQVMKKKMIIVITIFFIENIKNDIEYKFHILLIIFTLFLYYVYIFFKIDEQINIYI